MSKVLDAAKALVQMLEEKEKQDKVLLSALQAGETFKNIILSSWSRTERRQRLSQKDLWQRM